MNEEIKNKILKWIFDNHEHHINSRTSFNLDLENGTMEEIKEEKKEKECCFDNDYPYVNSIELEKFIKSL